MISHIKFPLDAALNAHIWPSSLANDWLFHGGRGYTMLIACLPDPREWLIPQHPDETLQSAQYLWCNFS